MKITAITVGPLAENCYVVADESGDAVIVDPGDEGERIAGVLRDQRLTPKAIWLTHAHFDHIGGIAGLKREFDVPVFLHPDDRVLYEHGGRAAARWGIPFEEPAPPDREVREGDVLAVGSLSFTVWHVPGHAPGHVIYHGHGVALDGDLIFQGSIGRTDLPFCDGEAMQRSLERAATLPPSTRLYPGHGPETDLATELRTNPFLLGIARPVTRPG